MRTTTGRADNVNGDMQYAGQAGGRRPEVNENGSPSTASTDGQNTVGWRSLGGSGAVGRNCQTYIPLPGFDEITHADIALDNSGRSWTNSPGSSSCSSAYDVESIVTHEAGHSFGLEYLPRDSYLTMIGSSALPVVMRTLGLGDLLSLEALY